MINQHYYEQRRKQMKQISEKMKNGVAVGKLLCGQGSKTHYLDSLQRFQKDFASYDKQRREEEKKRKQEQTQKKRLMMLQRENKRWQQTELKLTKQKEKDCLRITQHIQGLRRSANTNSLPYNPISLSYDRNGEGQKLRYKDEQKKIRQYVRAHNMDYRGNSKYNPLNGGDRTKIQSIVPSQLSQRFQDKKRQHYEHLKVYAPSTASSEVNRSHYTTNKCL